MADKKLPLLKKAGYLIPFIKPLTLGLIDPKDELTKGLLGAGLDLFGAEAKEKLKDLFTNEPDAATGLLAEHLVRHTGAVLGQIVRRYAKDPAVKNQRADLLKLAKVVPGAWAEFLKSGHGKMPALGGNALNARLADALSPQELVPEVAAEAFVEFFRWTGKNKGVSAPYITGLIKPLVTWITDHLDQAMFTDLCRETPKSAAAFKEIVLRYHAQAQGKLDVLETIFHQHSASLGRIEEGQKKQATKDDVETLGKELKQQFQHFEKTSPLHEYLEGLKEEYHFIEVITLDTADDPKVREAMNERGIEVKDAYVEPPCSEQYQHPEEFDAEVLNQSEKCEPFMARLAEHKRIVLLADPGMGKSTLVRSLLHSIASRRPPREAAEALANCVPFPLIMRDLVPMLLERQPDSSQWRWADLLEVFQSWCPGNSTRPLLAPFTGSPRDRASLQQIFESELAFFLVDGLDEVGSAALRQDMQRVLWEGFSLVPWARFLITSRVIGYDAAPVDRRLLSNHTSSPAQQAAAYEEITHLPRAIVYQRHAALLHLTPFTDGHQRQFAKYWFGKRFSAGGAEGSMESFIAAAHGHDSVRVIGRNPYVLLLLVFVYQDQHRLPDGRTKIYERVADLYLKVLDDKARVNARISPIAQCRADQKKRWLQIIAMQMQIRRTQALKPVSDHEKPETQETHSATGADITGWLEGHIECNGYRDLAEAAHSFVEYLGERTGLLVQRGPDHFEWHHNSFMEFFAALYIHDQLYVADQLRLSGLDPDATREELEASGLPPESLPGPIPACHAELARWAGDERWREVILFLVEYLAGPGKTLEVLRHLRGIFPALHGVAAVTRYKNEPLLPMGAVDLLVRIAHDSHLDLPKNVRVSWWQRLWAAFLECKGFAFWNIPPVLLEREELRTEVLQALVTEQPHHPNRSLTFMDCHQLTSSDLQHLSGLQSLRQLVLWGCAGLRDIDALAGLKQLEDLALIGCTGLESARGFQGLAELKSLQNLDLGGCDGFEDTAVLAGLQQLEILNLQFCTSLAGARALRGIEGLERLRHLEIRECRQLDENAVREVRGFIRAECEIIGPDGERVEP